MTPKVQYALDFVEERWDEYMFKKNRRDEDDKWIDAFREALETAANGAEEFYLRGVKVATHHPIDNMQASALRKDNPALYEEFVELVTERKFDKELFKKKHPELYKQYQSRQFRLVD